MINLVNIVSKLFFFVLLMINVLSGCARETFQFITTIISVPHLNNYIVQYTLLKNTLYTLPPKPSTGYSSHAMSKLWAANHPCHSCRVKFAAVTVRGGQTPARIVDCMFFEDSDKGFRLLSRHRLYEKGGPLTRLLYTSVR